MLHNIKINKMYKFLFFIWAALVFAGSLFAFGNSKIETRKLESRIGQSIFQQIAAAQNVSIARAVKGPDNKFTTGEREHVLTADKVDQLKTMLLDDKSYFFDKTKKCLFVPEVIFRFQNERSITIMVNLICNQIKFIDGERTNILDYDPMEEKFNAFCRDILEQMDKQ